MPLSHRRVQVTVDAELAAAMAEVDPRPRSRSKLIRDLALRGAQAERAADRRREEATEHLLRISRGEVEYDFDGVEAIHAEREADIG